MKTPKKLKPTKTVIKLPLLERLVKDLSNRESYYGNRFRNYFAGVDYSYETDYPCQDGDDCCDNDYCRCGIIVDKRITEVDINTLIVNLIGSNDDIHAYCVDRFVRKSNLKETGYWELASTGGYYGEEIDGVYPNNSIVDQLILDFKALIMLNDADKIKDCLHNEYGHVLPELDKCNRVEIAEVPLDNIELFNQNHYRKLEKKYIDQYNDYKLPRAVCVNTGTKYRLIDGYHRMHSAVNMKMDKVKILILS